MPSRILVIALSTAGILSAFPSVHAAPTTSKGEISVAQVIEALEKAPQAEIARQVVTAYFAGVGETAGLLVKAAGSRATCKTSLRVDGRMAQNILKAAAAQGNPAELAATPLIVDDMLKRAGCSFRG